MKAYKIELNRGQIIGVIASKIAWRDILKNGHDYKMQKFELEYIVQLRHSIRILLNS